MMMNIDRKPETLDEAIAQSAFYARNAIELFSPKHVVTMVSGGNDSAACHHLAIELGLPVTMTIHGRTGCGLQGTTDFVAANYGTDAPLEIADAGKAYEEYVMRKGFFGKGVDAHGFAYRILKAGPFRKLVSASLRKGKTGVRVMMLNGAFAAESANRKANLKRGRIDPGAQGNMWFNLIHDWTPEIRDEYLLTRGVKLNPVAQALCRSGECMCGTMQTDAERIEAAAFDPAWGRWLTELENAVIEKHGFGWGKPAPNVNKNRPDLFMPMCVDCGQDHRPPDGRFISTDKIGDTP
jgi:3'-phosphoadenosine 5'-phosphosulfate sulfotransferase (PAPS reductase)/FAD synthetase